MLQHAPSPVTDANTHTQGLRCFPLFLVRIIVGALLSIVYAASYSDQGYTFTAATERGFVFMLVTGILPLLTLTSLPVYSNAWKVGAACGPSSRLPRAAVLMHSPSHVCLVAQLCTGCWSSSPAVKQRAGEITGR